MASKDDSPEGTPEKVAATRQRSAKPAAKTAKRQTAKAQKTKADAVEAKAAEAKAAPEVASDKKTASKAAAKKPGTKATAKPRGQAAARARTATRNDTRAPARKSATKPAQSAEATPAEKSATPKSAAPAKPASAADEVKKVSPETAAQPAQTEGAQADPQPDPGSAEAVFAASLANLPLPTKMVENLERIEMLGQRLMSALAKRRPPHPSVEGPGQEFYRNTANAWVKLWAEQPARIIERQVNFWGETLKHYANVQSAFAKGKLGAPDDPGPDDRRFKNPLWQKHPFFNFVKQQYQIGARAIEEAASDLDLEDEIDRKRMGWFTRQLVDMLSPTNFLATNPDALEKALETEGESLVKGLENLVRDIEVNGGELVVSLADRDAFKVGENIGTTPGSVVARTPLYELIQFTPTTEKVHKTPIVVFPPWINKYYIMDLKPQNSLLRWILDQGYTLFVVSWKNPDASYSDTGMDDYVSSYLSVFDQVLEKTGEKDLNAVGYCIAGTTLSLTLALMKKRGDNRVKSATFFTTLTDFSDQGEFTTFLQDDFVGGIEHEVARTGYLGGSLMARTFSFLRANDLVWQPAIRSYMLGEPPPAFDLLYWNGDSTNLPGRMAVEYLRGLCQSNQFAGDGYSVLGESVRLSDVTLPLCAIAAEGDHIAPWKDSWRGVAQMGSEDKQFILSESGHIAGIINPPSKKKYGHYTSDVGFAQTYREWREEAEYHEGSWWPRWQEWLASRSGAMIPARAPQNALAPAPGTYVHERQI